MSGAQDWLTPPEIWKPIHRWCPIWLDPSPNAAQTVPAEVRLDDGLGPWPDPRPGALVFCNPPYRDVMPWYRKMEEESARGHVIALLTNACTDTEWGQECLMRQEVLLLRGRIRFMRPDGAKKVGNPKPSMLTVFNRLSGHLRLPGVWV